MRHSDFVTIKNSLKGKAFVAIIIGLCITVSFCPQTTESASRNSSSSPEFSSANSGAFLPAPVQIEGELCTLKCNDNIARRTITTSSMEISSLRYKLVSPTSSGNGLYLTYSSGTRGADFRITCQLLNLPPPFALSWLQGGLSGEADNHKISPYLSA